MRPSQIVLVILVVTLAWCLVNAIPTSELHEPSYHPMPGEVEQTDEENVESEVRHDDGPSTGRGPLQTATEEVVDSSDVEEEANKSSAPEEEEEEVTESAVPQSDSVEITGQEEVTNGPEVAAIQNDEIRTDESKEEHETYSTEPVSTEGYPTSKRSGREERERFDSFSPERAEEAKRLMERLVEILGPKWILQGDYEYVTVLKDSNGSIFVPQNPRGGNRQHLATLLGFVGEIIAHNNGFNLIERYVSRGEEPPQNSSEFRKPELEEEEQPGDLEEVHSTESQSKTSASEPPPNVAEENSGNVHNQPAAVEEQHELTEHEEQDQTEAQAESEAHEEGCTDESHSHHPADEESEEVTEPSQ